MLNIIMVWDIFFESGALFVYVCVRARARACVIVACAILQVTLMSSVKNLELHISIVVPGG